MIEYCLFGIVSTVFTFVNIIIFFASLSLQIKIGKDELDSSPAGALSLIMWTLMIEFLNFVIYIIFMDYDPCLHFVKENLGSCQGDLETNQDCACCHLICSQEEGLCGVFCRIFEFCSLVCGDAGKAIIIIISYVL